LNKDQHPILVKEEVAGKIGKNTSLLALSDIFGKFFFFLYFALAARSLGVERFGSISFATGLVNFCLIFIDLGACFFIVREVARDFKQIKENVREFFGLRILLAFLTIIMIAILIRLFNRPSEDVKIIIIVSSTLLFNANLLLLNSLFQALEKMEYIALSRILLGAMLAIGAFLCYKVFRAGTSFAFVYTLSFFLAFCFNYIILAKNYTRLTPVFNLKAFVQILRKILPFTLTTIFATSYYWFGIILLSLYQDNTAIGYYNAPFRLALGLTFVPVAFAGALYPLLSRYFKEGQIDEMKKILFNSIRFIFFVGFLVAIFVTLFAQKIILILYGSNFQPSVPVFQIIIWWVFFIYLNTVLVHFLYSINSQIVVTKQAGIAVLINLLANFFLIPLLSSKGVAVALILGEAASFLYLFINLFRRGFIYKFRDYLFILIKVLPFGIIIYLVFAFRLPFFAQISSLFIIYLLWAYFCRLITKGDYEMLRGMFKTKRCS